MSTLPRPTIIAVESDIDFKIACKPTIKRRQGQRRGIMKVRTLDESLRSCNSNSTVPPLTTISATNSSTVTIEQRHSSALSAPTLVEGGGPDEFLPSHVPSLAVTSDPTCRERDRVQRLVCHEKSYCNNNNDGDTGHQDVSFIPSYYEEHCQDSVLAVDSTAQSGACPEAASTGSEGDDVSGLSSYANMSIRDEDDHNELGKSSTSIRFATLTVREYERTVGDNPCVRSGPPVSIGWKYNVAGTISVDNYEKYRSSKDPRLTGELVIDRTTREKMMMDWGHSRADLRDAVSAASQTKRNRLQTVNNLKLSKLEERFENCRKGIKGLFHPKWRRKLKAEDKYWNDMAKREVAEMKKMYEEEAIRAEAFIKAENQAAALGATSGC